MNKWSLIIISILVIVCIWIYVHKPSGYEQQRKKIENVYHTKIDSIQSRLDSLRVEHVKWMAFVGKSELSAQKWEGEAKQWKRKYNEEINNRRHFSDASIDSLLANVR